MSTKQKNGKDFIMNKINNQIPEIEHKDVGLVHYEIKIEHYSGELSCFSGKFQPVID